MEGAEDVIPVCGAHRNSQSLQHTSCPASCFLGTPWGTSKAKEEKVVLLETFPSCESAGRMRMQLI